MQSARGCFSLGKDPDKTLAMAGTPQEPLLAAAKTDDAGYTPSSYSTDPVKAWGVETSHDAGAVT